MLLAPRKDQQSVTPEGQRLAPQVDGVEIRMAVTHPDERGEICEIYNPQWEFAKGAFKYVYMATVRPQQIKGWVVHKIQDDRLFIAYGALKIVLYDARPESPTYRMVTENVLTERDRGSIFIPHGVFHAVQNIGHSEGMFVNCPTHPYDHADPDKFRLPNDTDEIPYTFVQQPGW